MKLTTVLQDYLTFNRTEQRGIFVLLMLLFGVVITNFLLPLMEQRGPIAMPEYEQEVADFQKAVSRADSLERTVKKNKYSHKNMTFTAFRKDTGFHAYHVPKESFVIGLNSSDTFEFQRLRGIGPAFARRIVKYRERLHGFTNKSQLLEIWGVDTTRFNLVKDHLLVERDSVHPMDLNTVTFKELLSHPYFPFVTTKAIMMYRKDHKKFIRVSELKSIPLITDSAYQKIKDYVKVE